MHQSHPNFLLKESQDQFETKYLSLGFFQKYLHDEDYFSRAAEIIYARYSKDYFNNKAFTSMSMSTQSFSEKGNLTLKTILVVMRAIVVDITDKVSSA